MAQAPSAATNFLTPEDYQRLIERGRSERDQSAAAAQRPMTHWTQALASILGQGFGQVRMEQAEKQKKAAESAGTEALARYLRGEEGGFEAAYSNPYSRSDALKIRIAQQKTSENPASVREWEYYNSLPPEKQEQYLRMKRSQNFLNLGDRFVAPSATDPTRPAAQYGVGQKPLRTIQDGRVIEMPGTPGSPTGPVQPQQSAVPVQGQPPGAPAQAPAVPGAATTTQGGVRVTELPQSSEDRRKEEGRKASTIRAGTTVVQDLGRALNLMTKMPKISQQDGIAGATARVTRSKIFGTPEYQIAAFKESALSNVGIDTLQRMRENSPTGGALGQVPFQQQQRLEQVLGSIDLGQDPKIIRENMKRIQNIYLDIMFGDEQERQQLILEGKLTPKRNAEIQKRYNKLSFDEMGNPINQTPTQPTQTAPAVPPPNRFDFGQGNMAPQGFSIRKLD